jgi:hypothetical protein
MKTAPPYLARPHGPKARPHGPIYAKRRALTAPLARPHGPTSAPSRPHQLNTFSLGCSDYRHFRGPLTRASYVMRAMSRKRLVMKATALSRRVASQQMMAGR